MTPTEHPASRPSPPSAPAGRPGHEAHHHYTPAELHNPEVAHEHSDINVRAVLLFAAGLVAVAAVLQLSMYFLLATFQHQAAANDRPVSPMAAPAGQLPPEPRLQTNEPAGLKQFRDTEQTTLEGWGWVDQKSGIARMPIEDAKKRLLQLGFPARSQPADEKLGTHAAAYGEATGGRGISR